MRKIEFDPFVDPQLNELFMDRYVIRKGILSAISSCRNEMRGTLLDVGAGNQPYRKMLESWGEIEQYIPLDLANNWHYQDAENTWNGVVMPFEESQFDCAMATEVLEHCPHPEGTLAEIHRVLKDQGLFFFTVPFVWPLHDAPHDEYRYTPWSLERLLKGSGFSEIKIWPTGGWNAALAQTIGLWVRRKPMSDRKRKWLSKVLLPFVSRLVRTDTPAKEFDHGFYLMPGIAGTARVAKELSA